MTERRFAIVMSRLPRLIDPQSAWLRGLRAALLRIQQESGRLLLVPDTAGWPFLQRGAMRLTLPIEIPEEPAALPDGDQTNIPERDRRLIHAADTILALQIRPHGNIHRALCLALQRGQRVELAAPLSPVRVVEDLLSRGALEWPVPDLPDWNVDVEPAIPVYELVPFPADSNWHFLTHTTRACAGPWPDQTLEEYIDLLLDHHPAADHSAVSTLMRIVTEQRLRASGTAIRDQIPVVCFTEVPLGQLPEFHRFRAHRTRWDFEPYGLCIARTWLEQQGARPVIYGDDAVWNTLTVEERYRFQRAKSRLRARPDRPPLDWTIEREWRHAGDVELAALPPDQGLIFVPNAAEARRLAAVSPWPVTLWPGL